ncbi:hypothetical protein OMAG_001254, partial [Candidatus Omnitrophus magneticus]
MVCQPFIDANAIDSLSPPIVSGSLLPEQTNPIKDSFARLAKPSAIANGAHLRDLLTGKFPQNIYINDDAYFADIFSQLHFAIDYAINTHIANRHNIPKDLQTRADKTLANLFNFKNHLHNML